MLRGFKPSLNLPSALTPPLQSRSFNGSSRQNKTMSPVFPCRAWGSTKTRWQESSNRPSALVVLVGVKSAGGSFPRRALRKCLKTLASTSLRLIARPVTAWYFSSRIPWRNSTLPKAVSAKMTTWKCFVSNFGKRLTNFNPNCAHVLEYLYLSILGNSKEFAIFRLPSIAPPDVIPSYRYKRRLNSQTLWIFRVFQELSGQQLPVKMVYVLDQIQIKFLKQSPILGYEQYEWFSVLTQSQRQLSGKKLLTRNVPPLKIWATLVLRVLVLPHRSIKWGLPKFFTSKTPWPRVDV